MPFVSVNKKGVVTAVSRQPFEGSDGKPSTFLNDSQEPRDILGKKLTTRRPLRLAVVANWDQECGISTYTKFLLDTLRPKVGEIRVFSEIGTPPTQEVEPCWTRGQSMHAATKKVLEWDPDFVLVQHEFGIFPKAPFLHQMLQLLDQTPYAVTLHSTYEHRDKTICTSPMKHVFVHTQAAKNCLRLLGNQSDVRVIPHGCVQFPDRKPLWNITQTPHAIVQFGFGFFYKGVDRAIEAVAKLKENKKYHDIYYLYLCSHNPHAKNIHGEYQNFLMEKVESMGLQDNVVVINKYHTTEELNNYLRVFKLALFPYLNNPENTVYGASGAVRIAMANGIPVVASESHLFDELPVPRPDSASALAHEIDKIFSDWKYREEILRKQDEYVENHSWEHTAQLYLQHIHDILKENTVTK